VGLSDDKLPDKPTYILGKPLTAIFRLDVDGSTFVLAPTKSFNWAITAGMAKEVYLPER
jgi:hypothetical protein